MQINIEVTQAELSEMDLSTKQLEAAVLENLDRGVDIPDDGGRVYRDMDFITIHGQKVPVDIVFQDSMEEPESACTNRLISAKVGEKTYHRLGADPRDVGDLVRQVAADLTTRCAPAPKLLTVMVTSFARGFSIDWPASVSAMTKAEVLGIPIVPATQTMADFERKPA